MDTPWTPEALLARLDSLGIATRTVRHPAVYTVEQARQHRLDMVGGFSKNLFVRNKKGRMWLLVLEEGRQVDLKTLARRVGAGRFSFASRERLQRYLGLEPGSVTPFGVINDHEGAVTVVVDQGLLALAPLHFHPLTNTMTTAIAPRDLLRFLAETGHEPQRIDLDEPWNSEPR